MQSSNPKPEILNPKQIPNSPDVAVSNRRRDPDSNNGTMYRDKSQIPNPLVKIISTFFFVGYFPFIPGTFASIAGIFLFYLIKGNPVLYISFTLILISLGFWVTGKAERLFERKDARCIVIDEIAGVLLSLMFIPYDLKLVIIAFTLFRILDALKPFPAARLEQRLGSIGIMADDIIAGLYTNIILQIVLRLASFKIS